MGIFADSIDIAVLNKLETEQREKSESLKEDENELESWNRIIVEMNLKKSNDGNSFRNDGTSFRNYWICEMTFPKQRILWFYKRLFFENPKNNHEKWNNLSFFLIILTFDLMS